ncbi:MAG TPA: hypothetical protein VHW26_00465 [Solirubrobacteraceae bacterium]|nr:hypothetical protein [Solirubrobacteraceae bacterium]
MIAEEWHWQAAQDGRWPEWKIGPDRELPERLRGVGQPTAREVADIYRALRKGREDKRDEPGAEDFYYGEMEMRRHALGAPGGPHRRVGERVLIWAYWATAGYGLRPLRSLIALGVVVASFASLTATDGLRGHGTYADALLVTLQTATLRSGTDAQLTYAGRWLQLPLRLLGPLFFGLILLSLRGRLKR